MKLSLIIPCYNEARNLPLLLTRAGEIFTCPNVELLLVDNGSTDDTPAVLQDLLPKYPFARSVRVEVNQGYGYGILTGLHAARGTILGWTHADMQTDPADALAGFSLFEGADNPDQLFVKGRRQHRPWGDVIFTAGMGIFETLLLQQRLWDINAQPTLFGRDFVNTWANPPSDFSLDLYAFYMARSKGLEVKRFPVLFGPRAHGTSHWNINWRAKLKFIRRTLDYSLRLRNSLKNL